MIRIQHMFGLARRTTDQLFQTTSALKARIQRLEDEQAQLRARLDGDRSLRLFVGHIAAAAQAAPAIGAAIERLAEAMRAPRAPIPRGPAGGLVRASTAWRYFNGTFMPESEKEAAYFEEYERYAAGGRARAAKALRGSAGTFLPTISEPKI
jgi:hypothetical protein